MNLALLPAVFPCGKAEIEAELSCNGAAGQELAAVLCSREGSRMGSPIHPSHHSCRQMVILVLPLCPIIPCT